VPFRVRPYACAPSLVTLHMCLFVCAPLCVPLRVKGHTCAEGAHLSRVEGAHTNGGVHAKGHTRRGALKKSHLRVCPFDTREGPLQLCPFACAPSTHVKCPFACAPLTSNTREVCPFGTRVSLRAHAKGHSRRGTHEEAHAKGQPLRSKC
jgi:hypothetical protein